MTDPDSRSPSSWARPLKRLRSMFCGVSTMNLSGTKKLDTPKYELDDEPDSEGQSKTRTKFKLIELGGSRYFRAIKPNGDSYVVPVSPDAAFED